MPVETIIVVSMIVAIYAVFGIALAWVNHRTG
jgi:hypothetical protein